MSLRARNRLNGLLLLLVFGLLGLIYGLAGPEAPLESLPAPSPDAIERIRIQPAGEVAMVLQRRADEWSLVEPVNGPANTKLVAEVLRFGFIRCDRAYPAAKLELSRLQLDPPRLRLWLNEQVFLFGDVDELDRRRYVQAGDRVHLCSDRLFPLLTAGWGAFLVRPPADRADR
jgi:hypothetical protein